MRPRPTWCTIPNKHMPACHASLFRNMRKLSILTRLTAALCLGLVGGCAGTGRAVKTAGSAYPEAENISRWPDEYPLQPEQEFGIAELGRTETSSVHIVQVRHRESLHAHEHHDMVAVLLRGHGTLRMGDRTFAMKEGSIVAIAHGMPHAFVNDSRQPAAEFVVFTPPFDGKDVVPVQE